MIVHFKLGKNFGKVITQLAREMAWEDGNIEKAVLMLVEDLQGITSALAREVVQGKKKLITLDDSQVGLEEDDWAAPDLDLMKRYVEDTTGLVLNLSISKREEIQDRYIQMAWEIREWAKTNVVRAFKKAKVLREELLEDEFWRKKDTQHYGGLLATTVARIQTSVTDPELKERLSRVAVGKMISASGQFEVAPDEKLTSDTGWLDVEGIFYGCGLGMHIALAERICDRLYPDAQNAEEWLEKVGWVKCTDGEWWYLREEGVTKKQMETLKKWAGIHNLLSLRWNHKFVGVDKIIAVGGVL